MTSTGAPQASTKCLRAVKANGEALTVPSEAVTYVDNEPTVFLASTPNRIVPTRIRLGLTDGAREEVLSGVSEGAQVVESGVFAIKSELFR